MVTEPSAKGASPVLEGGCVVTLKQVAAEAGVSLGVASTVLSGGNNNIRVAPATQSRVLEAAQALGYRSRRSLIVRDSAPSSQRKVQDRALSADSGRQILPSISVGIIASFNPSSDPGDNATSYDPWEHDITAGFEIALNDGASHVVTHYCNRGRRSHLPIPIEEALAQVLSLNVDALALIEISSAPLVVGRSVPLLLGSGRPIVVISTDALTAPVANVYFDSVNAGYQAARHLIDQGYGEICFLAPVRAPWADERIDGAREALLSAGISPSKLTVFPPEDERDTLPSFDARFAPWDHLNSGRQAGEALLKRTGTPPIAVIGANDGTAIGYQTAAAELGLRPGIDYALMGFDDAPLARENGLTTVRPPREGMGREAARLLLRLADGDDSARHQVRLNSHLMARRSTPPRGALIATSSLSQQLSSTLGSSIAL